MIDLRARGYVLLSICMALLAANVFAGPTGSCVIPEQCHGGVHSEVGLPCTCNGNAGLKNTSAILGTPVTGDYCSKNVNCVGTGKCDRIERWTMYIRWLECQSQLTEDVCHIRTCEDGVISRTVTGETCPCTT
ncbi:MAG: hypothetical protein ACAH95_11595 [Fimbriimonas sp.]